MALACLTQPDYIAAQVLEVTMEFIGSAVVNFYLGLFLYGGATLACSGGRSTLPPDKGALSVPFFPCSCSPIFRSPLSALVRKVEGTIRHTR